MQPYLGPKSNPKPFALEENVFTRPHSRHLYEMTTNRPSDEKSVSRYYSEVAMGKPKSLIQLAGW
jgi:hypothetical protein